MKTITIKVDDKYAGLISATFIGINQNQAFAACTSERMHDGMVITIDDNGKAKTEENDE